jgi:hypothetical protein
MSDIKLFRIGSATTEDLARAEPLIRRSYEAS